MINESKILFLSFLNLDHQTRTNQKISRRYSQLLQIQIVFKSQNKLSNAFHLKYRIPKELISGIVYKFQCGLCNESYYDEYVRHFNVRNGELIKISKLTKNKVMHKGSAVSDHLLLCDHSPSFDSFSALTKQERRFVLQLKESLLIMRNEPSLNRNIRPAPLNLFNRVQFRLTALLGSSVLGFSQ